MQADLRGEGLGREARLGVEHDTAEGDQRGAGVDEKVVRGGEARAPARHRSQRLTVYRSKPQLIGEKNSQQRVHLLRPFHVHEVAGAGNDSMRAFGAYPRTLSSHGELCPACSDQRFSVGPMYVLWITM